MEERGQKSVETILFQWMLNFKPSAYLNFMDLMIESL